MDLKIWIFIYTCLIQFILIWFWHILIQNHLFKDEISRGLEQHQQYQNRGGNYVHDSHN